MSVVRRRFLWGAVIVAWGVSIAAAVLAMEAPGVLGVARIVLMLSCSVAAALTTSAVVLANMPALPEVWSAGHRAGVDDAKDANRARALRIVGGQ